MCDMTHSYVWHDSFIRVTWLIHMCDMTHSYVWHDSFIYVIDKLKRANSEECDITRETQENTVFLSFKKEKYCDSTRESCWMISRKSRLNVFLFLVADRKSRWMLFSSWLKTGNLVVWLPVLNERKTVLSWNKRKTVFSFFQRKSRGWRRCIGCLKLQVIFRKRATNSRALWRKMTYKDKASYASSPPSRGKWHETREEQEITSLVSFEKKQFEYSSKTWLSLIWDRKLLSFSRLRWNERRTRIVCQEKDNY